MLTPTWPTIPLEASWCAALVTSGRVGRGCKGAPASRASAVAQTSTRTPRGNPERRRAPAMAHSLATRRRYPGETPAGEATDPDTPATHVRIHEFAGEGAESYYAATSPSSSNPLPTAGRAPIAHTNPTNPTNPRLR